VFLVLLTDSGLSAVTSLIPLWPAAVDTLFQGHLYAAHMVQKDIEKTWYVEGRKRAACDSGAHPQNLEALRRMTGKTRLVYLG